MPFTHPLNWKVCPFCMRTFRLGDAPITSLRTGAVLVEPKKETLERMQSMFYVRGVEDSRFVGEQPRRMCPHCNQVQPSNIDTTSNRIIAVIGGAKAGKSHYIATVIQQLLYTSALRDIGCDPLLFADEATDREYREQYYEPLFERHQELSPTVSVAQPGARPRPLIYQLVHRHEIPVLTRRINLVFFDAAGEDFKDGEQMELYSRYIAYASGLLFFVDPLQMDKTLHSLASAESDPATELSGTTPEQVMNRVMILYQQIRSLAAGEKIPVPAAIVVSKSDLLQNLHGMYKGSTIFRDSVHKGGFDASDHRQVNEEVSTFLSEYGASPIVDRAHALFKTSSFFTVSATGRSPDQNRLFPVLESRRCLDPIFWLLTQMRILNNMPDPATRMAAAPAQVVAPAPVAQPYAAAPAPMPAHPPVQHPAQPVYYNPAPGSAYAPGPTQGPTPPAPQPYEQR